MGQSDLYYRTIWYLFVVGQRERQRGYGKENGSVSLNGGRLGGGSQLILIPFRGLCWQHRASAALRWRGKEVDNRSISGRLYGILVQHRFRQIPKDNVSQQTFMPSLTVDDLCHCLGEVELVLDVGVALGFEVFECSGNVFIGCIEGDFVEAVCEDDCVLHCVDCSLACTWQHLFP